MSINHDQMTDPLAMLRLLQLCSATLPVGAFSFSQGLEYAIDKGWLVSEDDVNEWLSVNLSESMAHLDIPVLFRMRLAINNNQENIFFYWSDYLLASRESAEMFKAEQTMGVAMFRLLKSLDLASDKFVPPTPSFLAGYALASTRWHLSDQQSAQGYVWSWLENQVAAASKLLPMGQTQAQQMLLRLSGKIPSAVAVATTKADEDIGANLPALAMASAWHETQYSRLFRS